MSQLNMLPCILIGGPYAGFKTQVPEGKKILRIDDDNEVQTAATLDAAKKIAGQEKLTGTLYQLELCVITSPTLNDVMSFVVGWQLATSSFSQAVMELVAAYSTVMMPEVFENES